MRFDAGTSPCERAFRWQRALSLLRGFGMAILELGGHRNLQRWDQRVRGGRAIAAGPFVAQRGA
eukprot:1353058-Pyramimonas_sp.AAC.1